MRHNAGSPLKQTVLRGVEHAARMTLGHIEGNRGEVCQASTYTLEKKDAMVAAMPCCIGGMLWGTGSNGYWGSERRQMRS